MSVSASVTLYVTIDDAQDLWDGAFEAMAPMSREDFESLCGSRDEPDEGNCLRMLFDPGVSPPGITVDDSEAEVNSW